MATIPGTQLAGVFRVHNKPENFSRFGSLELATPCSLFMEHSSVNSVC